MIIAWTERPKDDRHFGSCMVTFERYDGFNPNDTTVESYFIDFRPADSDVNVGDFASAYSYLDGTSKTFHSLDGAKNWCQQKQDALVARKLGFIS